MKCRLISKGRLKTRFSLVQRGDLITLRDILKIGPLAICFYLICHLSSFFFFFKIPKHKYLGRNRPPGNVTCDSGDYLALLENVNGKILEISRFCGNGRVPRIYSRGRNVILEFFARKDGTVTHDGFQVTLQEEEEERVSQVTRHANCAFVYRSSVRNSRENIRSPRSWYPPNTVCTYKFLGRIAERVSIYIKILRNEFGHEKPETKRNFSLNYCPGNEISVYNGARVIDLFILSIYFD